MSLEHKYPEHEKLRVKMTLSDFAQRVGEWLETNGYAVCQEVCKSCHRPAHDAETLEALPYRSLHEDTEWTRVPISGGTNGLLAQMFGIDLDVLEDEKRHMLNRLREANDRAVRAAEVRS